MSLRFARVAASVAFLASTFPVAARAADAGGTIALTSDYVFRGISQTRGGAALQVGAWVESTRGWYGSAWASNVDYGAASDAVAEVDAVVGWRGALGDGWRGDLNFTRFAYPGDDTLAYTELIGTATWRERGWLMLGLSNDVFATGERGTYLQAGWRFPLPRDVRIEIAAAQYFLDSAYGRDYRHAQLTAAWTPRPNLELRLLLHAPDADARRLSGEAADPRIEGAVQWAF